MRRGRRRGPWIYRSEFASPKSRWRHGVAQAWLRREFVAGYARLMETQHDPTEEPDEATSALNEDNPDLPDDAGEKGAGDATGASGGLERGSEPRDQDARRHEQP